MKRTVLSFGLIAGFIISAFMVVSTLLYYKNDKFEASMVMGYAAMIIAFSMIFIAIKNYRDKYNNGLITFGKAFKIGLYVSLIASTIYVVVWMIDYYLFIPDFMERYTNHVLQEAKAGGASEAELNKQVTEMAGYKEMYKNPLFVMLFTYTEILPVGLIISVISALILKRKEKPDTLVVS